MKISRQTKIARHLRQTYFGVSMVLALLLGLGIAHKALAATPTPLAGLDFLTQITIPNWTTGGATQASTDVWSFDPSTNTSYFADRVNKGVSVVDTNTNTYLGTIVVPSCNVAGAVPGSCPSGVLVAPDLHKLVITDRNTVVGGVTIDLNHIFIYDLKLGQFTPPGGLTLPFGQDSDELDYDPLNQRAYVANTAAPYFLTVVDLVGNKIVDQIPLPSNPEQPRFNPVDGFIYQTIPDDTVNGGANSAVLRIDTTKTSAAAIVKTFVLGPSCLTRGIDIDPLTNTAIIGCAAPGGQVLMDLTGNMSIQATFPGVTGTDTLQFNPNLRRWYTASSNNSNSGVQCPGNAASPQVFPVVGVFAAAQKTNQTGTIVGAECSGTNGHDIGVDPVHNQVYVGVRQLADPTSLSSGKPGVLVWQDPAPLAQPELIEESHVSLKSLAGKQAMGKVLILDSHIVSATLASLPSGDPTLNITTTIGNEVVNCERSGKNGICSGLLRGEALIGGVAFMASSGTPLAKGTIQPGSN